MSPVNPTDLLIRAAISAVAATVTTSVLVNTADSAEKKRKKKRQAERKKKGKKGKKKSSTMERMRDAERRADTPGRRATSELELLPEPGMSVSEFLESVKRAPGRASDMVAGVFAKKPPAGDAVVDDGSRKSKRRKKKDGFETLKEEMFHVAKTAVKDKIVEKSGVGPAIDVVGRGANAVKNAADDALQKIKSSVPDELGEKVGDASRAIAEGGKRLGRAVTESIPDSAEDLDALKDKFDGGIDGFARWVEGPGAPNYRRRDGETTDPGRPKALAVDARAQDVDTEPSAPDVGEMTTTSANTRRDVDDPTAALKLLLDDSAALVDDDASEASAGSSAHADSLDAHGNEDANATSGADDRGVFQARDGTPKARPIFNEKRGPPKAR